MLVWSIGEVLWDVFPDQERFGGAALNVCVNLQRLGDQATLLSAVGHDQRGRRALERMSSLGLSRDGIRQVEELPTGVATVSTGADGEPSFAIPRPAAFDAIAIDPNLFAKAEAQGVDWLYFGTLLQTNSEVERFTTALARHLPRTRCFYDINLRAGHWNLALVQRLSRLASVLKINDIEARILFDLTASPGATFSLEEFCRMWSSAYGVGVICITLGPAGCMVYDRGAVGGTRGYPVAVCDTVGAGDAFAAAFLHGYHHGWPMSRTAQFANALGALVASRAGATPDWTSSEILAITGSSRGPHAPDC